MKFVHGMELELGKLGCVFRCLCSAKYLLQGQRERKEGDGFRAVAKGIFQFFNMGLSQMFSSDRKSKSEARPHKYTLECQMALQTDAYRALFFGKLHLGRAACSGPVADPREAAMQPY